MVGDDSSLEFAIDNTAEFDVAAFLRNCFESGPAQGVDYLPGRIKFRHTRILGRGSGGFQALSGEGLSRFQNTIQGLLPG